MDDESYKISNDSKMAVGGRTDKNDIIHELLKHIEIVFADQRHSNKYRGLTTNLEKYNSRLAKIVSSDGEVDTDEKFALKKELTEDLMDLLTMYIPEMLKDEPFFNDVFYKK